MCGTGDGVKSRERGGKEARGVCTPGGRQTAEGYTAGEGPLAREGGWEELTSAVVKVVCKAVAVLAVVTAWEAVVVIETTVVEAVVSSVVVIAVLLAVVRPIVSGTFVVLVIVERVVALE